MKKLIGRTTVLLFINFLRNAFFKLISHYVPQDLREIIYKFQDLLFEIVKLQFCKKKHSISHSRKNWDLKMIIKNRKLFNTIEFN